jgi:predicted dehydrogenase
MPNKIKVAVVGLNFGAEFVPIYQSHPDVESVAICDLDEAKLSSVGEKFSIEARFTSLDELLRSGAADAAHLFTPVPVHVEQSVTVLNAGMHCACAVPMATSLDGIRSVIAAQRGSCKNYMMMETTVYSREFFYAAGMKARGDFGELTFLRGTYYQDLDADYYARYWWAQPPMHYATHVVGPILALAGTRAARVCCFGSGRLRPRFQQPGGNSFALQTAIIQLAGSEVAAEVTRSWFQVAHTYTEAFSVYGDKRGFEWQQLEHEDPVVFTLPPEPGKTEWRDAAAERVHVPDRADLLPEPIRRFTTEQGHGGSHPHLVHEFVRSIVEGRKPAICEITAAEWTAPGICANESSLRDGEPVEIPDFRVE